MGKPIKTFEDLEVWQKAIDIGVELYDLTKLPVFQKEYSIKDQLIRASLSMSNNIAEGFEYDNRKDFIKYLRYSKGSTGEVRNILRFLVKAKMIDIGYHDKMRDKLIVLSKQLYTFIQYLKKTDKS